MGCRFPGRRLNAIVVAAIAVVVIAAADIVVVAALVLDGKLMLPQADGYHCRRSSGARCFRRSLDKSICGTLLDDASPGLGGAPWRSDPSTAAATPASRSLCTFAAAVFGVIPSHSS
jgi:hypothetical protein